MKKLIIDGLVKLFSGILLTGALTFIPAGTLHFWQGWVLLGTLFIPMFIAGLVMIAKNPDLLRKRLNAKEKQAEDSSRIVGTNVHSCIRPRRPEFQIRLDAYAPCPHMDSGSHLPRRICDVCRSNEGECLPVTHDRSTGKPKGRGHRSLRHRPPSNVFSNTPAVPIHATDTRLHPFIHHHTDIHPDNPQANEQRGKTPRLRP